MIILREGDIFRHGPDYSEVKYEVITVDANARAVYCKEFTEDIDIETGDILSVDEGRALLNYNEVARFMGRPGESIWFDCGEEV